MLGRRFWLRPATRTLRKSRPPTAIIYRCSLGWASIRSVKLRLARHTRPDFVTSGLLELEVRDSGREWSDLFEFLANIAHYELVTGVQIGDGETVGGSETERFVVRHTASRYMPETRVACVAA